MSHDSRPGEQIPVRVSRLSQEMDQAPDYIAPLAALAILVALLGTTCLPLWTVMGMLATGQDTLPLEDFVATPPATQPTTPTTPAATPPTAPQIPLVTLLGVLVFFLIAVLGIIGGIGTILHRQWGRRLLLAFAGLVLLYLVTAIYLRMRFGIEGLTQTAPTASALSLNLTCSLGAILLVAILMIVIIRYFNLPHIARRFN